MCHKVKCTSVALKLFPFEKEKEIFTKCKIYIFFQFINIGQPLALLDTTFKMERPSH